MDRIWMVDHGSDLGSRSWILNHRSDLEGRSCIGHESELHGCASSVLERMPGRKRAGSVWAGPMWTGSVWTGSVWTGSVWAAADYFSYTVILLENVNVNYVSTFYSQGFIGRNHGLIRETQKPVLKLSQKKWGVGCTCSEICWLGCLVSWQWGSEDFHGKVGGGQKPRYHQQF